MTTESGIEKLLGLSTPALIAIAGFFSWIMFVNNLRVSYWLYYERTVYLAYLGRSLDPTAWLLSSVLAVVLLAGAKRSRPTWLWPGILLLWLGIALGTLGLAGLGRLSIVAGSLLTLVGLAVGGNAVFKELTSTSRGYFVAAILLVLSLLVLPVELGSLTYYVLSAFHPGTGVGGSWELFELQLWYTAFPLVPFLYVLFLFSWIWAPPIAKIVPSSVNRTVNEIAERMKMSGGRAWMLAIGGYILLGALLGYYAYFQSPTYPLVGTDIYWRNALPAERVVASTSWLGAAAKERHPVVVLGIAILSGALGLDVELLLRFAYVALIISLGGVIFLLVLAASGNKSLASYSALMATVTPTATAGVYTGTIAEWIALIVWILSLAFLAVPREHDRGRHLISVVGLSLGSVAVLFIHPWTWFAMIVGLIAYCFIIATLRGRGALLEIGAVCITILVNAIALALSVLALSRTQGWRVADAVSLIQQSLGSIYFGLGSWEIVVFFSQIWSQFLNPMLLILSVLGAIILAYRRDRLSAIMFAWILAACATNLLAAPMNYDPLASARGETQIFRAMFLTPFQIPAAAGFLFLKSMLSAKMRQTKPRIAGVVVGIVLAVVFLAILNGAFRALFTLLIDAHNYPNPLAP